MTKIVSHRDLNVFRNLMDAAVYVFSLIRKLPQEEKFASADQARRSAPAACANLAEAWRKRPYKAAFMNKISDAEAEAGETQVWLELWWRVGYITEKEFKDGFDMYEVSIRQMMALQRSIGKWPSPAP